jgi:hypothetical protein
MQNYIIAKDLVCAESDYFKGACNGSWQEGRTTVVRLEEEDRDAFSIFAIWLTTNSLDNAMDLADYCHLNPPSITQDTTRITMQEKRYSQLAKCFLLGEYLQAENFKNVVMSDIAQTAKDYFQECWTLNHLSRPEGLMTPVKNLPLLGALPDNIADVYAKTSSTSLLRRFLVDMTVAFLRDDVSITCELQRHFHDANVPELQQKAPEFVAEVFRSSLERQIYGCTTSIIYPLRRDVCEEYHSHTDSISYHCELTVVSLSLMKVL